MPHGGQLIFYQTKVAKKSLDDIGEGLEWLLNKKEAV